MHGVYHMQFGQLSMCYFIIQHKLWNDTDHFTMMFQYRIGDLSHETNAGTTIDYTETLFSNTLRQLNGFFSINRFVSAT